MPSVTIENPNLESEGPVLKVQFSISSDLEEKYRNEKKTIPEQVSINAMIDTGATCCMIQEEIPKKLGLEPVSENNVITAAGKVGKCFVYWMKMIIPECDVSYEGAFTAISFDGQDIQCLIGRDFLKDSTFIYIGNKNQFSFSIS
jgi:predicted aspartyl protease